ncbi:MAG: NUDIX hydrolase [Pseudomonadota bacterium]
MDSLPRTGASVIVFQDQKVLLIKRGKEPYKGHWSLPGGSQEFGETLKDCAKRELKEETGLEASEMEFAATRDRIHTNNRGDPQYHFVLTTYVTQSVCGVAAANDDAIDIGWFTLEEMDGLLTTPETPSFVAEVLTKINGD